MSWNRWRRARRSRLVFVVVRVPGHRRIVPSGLVSSETLMLVTTTRREMF